MPNIKLAIKLILMNCFKRKLDVNVIIFALCFFMLLSSNKSFCQVEGFSKIEKETKQQSTISAFKMADEMPAFSGGDLALQKYIANNLLVPQKAISNQVNGNVLLDFIVNEDGSLSDIEVLEDIGQGCGEAAIKLVEAMPAWNPAVWKGKPIKMAYTLVVPFQLKPNINTKPNAISNNKSAQPQASSKSLRTYIAEHQTIAIIPADIVIEDRKYIKNKKSNAEALNEEEQELQTAVQYSLYQRMLWLQKRNRLKEIKIQDISITNKLLEKNGIKNMPDLMGRLPEEIANLLGVDAIFYCSGKIDKVLSKGAAIAIASLNNYRGNPPTDLYSINLNIYDGEDGNLIWGKNHNLNNRFVLRKHIKIIEESLKEILSTGFPYHYRF